jgi:hypothetical protein
MGLNEFDQKGVMDELPKGKAIINNAYGRRFFFMKWHYYELKNG